MGPMQAIMSGVMTIFYYSIVIAAVWKLFQVATDLGEIKTMLSEMHRTTILPLVKPVEPSFATPSAAPPLPQVMAGPISLASAEALLREVEAESHALAAAELPKTTA